MNLSRGNQIELLQSGGEFFPALCEAIAGAQQLVHLETYIFALDETGQRISAALCAAARRGVSVRLVIDGFGSRSFVDSQLDALTAAGVEVMVFRREISLLSLRRQRLRRLHRKLACIDGRLAFVGGINIIDDHDTPGQTPPRFDYAIRIDGPLAQQVRQTQENLWRTLRWSQLRSRTHAHAIKLPAPSHAGKIQARLVLRDNLRHRRDIEDAYLEAIAHARHEILIANAYFLPGRRFRNALLEARQRGVRVTLLLQGRVEYWLLHHACNALYPQLMAAGIRIVEYRKSFLHAKVAVIDDNWATVGSSNIDPFSLALAREANVIILNADFCHKLRSSLQAAIADGGHELSANHWQTLPPLRRLLSWTAYSLLRWLAERLAPPH
ncbi:cardiolipin synthase ClsB [Uliginosibacterium sediminicola]|uniref:Cardiolipin synthase B n=1 Tax=Uliginosibacterium sediminicola TaxID=2024550 RepID=A0ABU9YTB0_9RHOO